MATCGTPAAGDSLQRCDFSDGCTNAAETCCTGNGCPKYGDYNGNACAAGWLFAGWAEATGPATGTPPVAPIGILFSQILVGDVPIIQTNPSLTLPNVCVGGTSRATLNVCNTGTGILEVEPITSSSNQFAVTTPTGNYPVLVSPDFCFPFEVTFTPTSGGAKSGTLTIPSNDPSTPSVQVAVSGNAGVPESAVSLQSNGAFGNVAVGDFKILNLQVLNQSNICPLQVTNLARTVGSTDFSFAGVPSGLPLSLQPGSNVDLPLRFEPTIFGPQTADFRLTTSDPPPFDFAVTGGSPPPDVALTGSLSFGPVCAGVLAEKVVNVCNTGTLNTLAVSSVSLVGAGCDDFEIVNNPFPADVSHDFCIPVTVRYTPTAVGSHNACNLTVASNDPDEPSLSLPLTGSTPAPAIDVADSQSFPATVIQGIGPGRSVKPFPIENVGQCPLTITNIAISSNPAEFSFSGLPSFPIILSPGELAGDGALKAVFEPDVLARYRNGEISVSYQSDPIVPTTATETRNLCGEGVHTGARLLVTSAGAPLAKVDQIHLQRITGNRNRRILDTQEVFKNAALVTEPGNGVCPGFQYHREWGTISNPIQLLPGSYQITVKTRLTPNGKSKTKVVGFDVQVPDFRSTLVVDFPAGS